MVLSTSNKSGNNPTRAKIVAFLNKNRIGDRLQYSKVEAMGMSACQGLCITYHLHSKAFCK